MQGEKIAISDAAKLSINKANYINSMCWRLALNLQRLCRFSLGIFRFLAQLA